MKKPTKKRKTRSMAVALAGMGRNGDTILAHINPAEAALLDRATDGGTINPRTGLPEFNVGDDQGHGDMGDGDQGFGGGMGDGGYGGDPAEHGTGNMGMDVAAAAPSGPGWGGHIGSAVGGILGSAFGPVGAALGSGLGGYFGGMGRGQAVGTGMGGLVGSAFGPVGGLAGSFAGGQIGKSVAGMAPAGVAGGHMPGFNLGGGMNDPRMAKALVGVA